ncbi:di-heme oxidoredictase family protein [Marinomonas balearica]|uniref:CxxC motif-containing protein (DUF1111 family) n=1 Tax=Marinomonas balearica TaxID=491947 RepID=A0A4R6MG48_9GAMM|nr:di-heme oxidoredictase family protein [Marinomonas balearica]TDO99740.1 CxxC motif-containing protein (DUF1111 family) [Marinomonas balearica]
MHDRFSGSLNSLFHFRQCTIAVSVVLSSISIQAVADKMSYTTPLSGLSAEEKLDFELGRSIFERFWVPSPSSTTASDGLGPIFNARSCHSCHMNGGRGHAPQEGQLGSEVPSFFVRLGNKTSPLTEIMGDETYGRQFQQLGSSSVPSEGDYTIHWETKVETFKDGSQVTLKKPSIEWGAKHYGEFQPTTGISLRVTPPLVGMGLIDAIDPETILANEDADDRDNDGISGKANWVYENGRRVIGRFGHKAHVSDLSHQNQSAFNGDLGLSTPLFPKPSGDCTSKQLKCIQAPNGNTAHIEDLEVGHFQSDRVDEFVALSRPPAMRNLQEPWFIEGKAIFDKLACASCHTPKMTSGSNVKYDALKNRRFYPFTDLLLHDMGRELANEFPVFNAEPQEWRTAPLWGIGLSEAVSGRKGFLHDGRAATIEEAILWHGGEAEPHKNAYKALSKANRDLFMKFLESL